MRRAVSSLMIGLLIAREPGLGRISRKMRCYEHLDLERGSAVLSSGVFSQDARRDANTSAGKSGHGIRSQNRNRQMRKMPRINREIKSLKRSR